MYKPVYSQEQEKLIKEEFSRTKGECYLEHAGATLYSEKQLSAVFSELSSNTYGNPHSRNKSGKSTEDVVDQIRFRILQHFGTNADEYSVIFTSGATASAKIVGESFQYGDGGTFVYLCDNHTSILGMREYSPKIFPLKYATALEVFEQCCEKRQRDQACNSLFTYPAECNFSGTKYPLSWIQKTQSGVLDSLINSSQRTKWFCMLDAACFAGTNALDLNRYKPDFVCLSFYKIFGYPSGLGALLVKNASAYVLKKTYFGGGTVLMALAEEQTHVLRPVLHERFEDGTLPFLSIISLRHGFETFQRLSLTMDDISHHTFNLARYVFHTLKTLQHTNGEPIASLYHDGNFEDVSRQGGIINFNLLRPDRRHVGYSEVLDVANLYGIHLRTGCFCNPGACQRHLGLNTEDVKYHFNSGHVCGDQHDLIDGYPTGSVRISFGYMSTKQDADTFLTMINEYFVSKPIERIAPIPKYCSTIDTQLQYRGVLKQIFIYPIKSCAAVPVQTNWKIVKTGLQYDRQWMIVNSNGAPVTQKNDTRLALIVPKILSEQGLLQVSYESMCDKPNNTPGSSSITIPLNTTQRVIPQQKCHSKVCRDRVQGLDCGNEIAEWLVDILGVPGLRLLRQYNEVDSVRKYKKDDFVHLSLSNQAQFLLINLASVRWLIDHIATDCDFEGSISNVVARFRPNFVAEFSGAFVENSFSGLRIGQVGFTNEGACTRCQMICINQSTGERTIEPLRTLSKVFNGKINFGIYLNHTSASSNIVCRNESILCFVNSLNKLK